MREGLAVRRAGLITSCFTSVSYGKTMIINAYSLPTRQMDTFPAARLSPTVGGGRHDSHVGGKAHLARAKLAA